MKLNHIDLPVADIADVRTFFVNLLDFRSIFEREDGLTVLLDETDFALTLSPLVDGGNRDFPEGFHIGFNLSSEEALRKIHAELANARIEIVRSIGDLGGALTFHCRAPGNLLIEFAWRCNE